MAPNKSEPEVRKANRSSGKGSSAAPNSGRRPRDLSQLEAIYREHYQFVLRNLLRLGVPDHSVDDAVHDCFLVLAKRLHEFEGRSKLRTWLFAIVYNVARGLKRDLGRQMDRQIPLADSGELTSKTSNPEQLSDAARQLHHLLQQLDEGKRAVFVMAELEQMTAPEIAQVLNLKLPTVYSRIRLARTELERAVAEMGDSQ